MEVDDGPPGLVREEESNGHSGHSNGSRVDVKPDRKVTRELKLPAEGRRISLVAVVHSIAAFATNVGKAFAPDDGDSHLIGSDDQVHGTSSRTNRFAKGSKCTQGRHDTARSRRHSEDGAVAALERGEGKVQGTLRGEVTNADIKQQTKNRGRRTQRSSMPSGSVADSQHASSGVLPGRNDDVKHAWGSEKPGVRLAGDDPVQRILQGLGPSSSDIGAGGAAPRRAPDGVERQQCTAGAQGSSHPPGPKVGFAVGRPGQVHPALLGGHAVGGGDALVAPSPSGATSPSAVGAGPGRSGSATSGTGSGSVDGKGDRDRRGRRTSALRRPRASVASLKGGSDVRPAKLASSTMSYDPGDDCCGDACQCFLWGEDFGDTYH